MTTIIYAILIIFLLISNARAEVITIQGGCSSSDVLVDVVPRLSGYHGEVQSEGCLDAVDIAMDEVAAFPKYSGLGCYHRPGAVPVSIDCSTIMCGMCCPSAVAEELISKEDTVLDSGTVTEIPVGQERDAAETFFNNFNTENEYVDHSSEGWLRTDGLTGFVYTATLDESGNTASVNVSAWKRGGYGKGEDITTLEESGGGGGGGEGPSAEEIGEAVGDAIGEKFGEYTGTDPGINDSASRENTQSELDAVSGTYEDMPEQSSITDSITDFLESNPVLSVFRSSSVSAVSGSCSFTTSLWGQNISIGLCDVGDQVSLFGSIFLIVACLYSFLIALGRA